MDFKLIGFLKSLRDQNSISIKTAQSLGTDEYRKGYCDGVISQAINQNKLIDSILKDYRGALDE